MRRFTRPGILTAIALAASGIIAASTAAAQTISCPPSGNADINQAINSAPFGQVAIAIEGECSGDVTIARDDVSLTGSGSGGTINGRIFITGDRVVISDLEVAGNGSGDGITVDNGGSATISNVEVKGHRRGVVVRLSSTVRISESEIKDSVQQNLLVVEGSSARLSNSKVISTSSSEAIGVFRLGALRLFGGGNEITNTAGRAIFVAHGSQIRQDGGPDEITGDVVATALSEIDLREFELHGNVTGSEKGVIRLRNGVLAGTITLGRDSDAVFSTAGGPVTVNGSLHCDDEESSHFAAGGTVINGANTCSGY